MGDPFIRALQRGVYQTAVYWANPRNDGFGGTEYDAPVEIDCRWREVRERFTDQNGVEQTSQAEVLVFQDLEIGGLLYLGKLGDLASDEEASPEQLMDAFKVKKFEKVPLLTSETDHVRIARL